VADFSADRAEWGTASAPARHALLRVAPEAYALTLAARPDLAAEPLLREWAERGRPLVARRRGPCDAPGRVAAGIPLPPSHGKKRIAVQLSPGEIESVEPPPLLIAAARCAPAGWGATIDAILALSALSARVGVDVRAFGGLGWSALTGLQYLSESSDLDLLFPIESGTRTRVLLDGLARIEAFAPMRFDGELVRLDAGLAANWRELFAGAGEVLVKTIDGVALWPARAFLFAGETGAQNGRAAS
jgi:phosphoribosyl-dephospho-CoA transferase